MVLMLLESLDSLFLVAELSGATTSMRNVCRALGDALTDDAAWRAFELRRWPLLAAVTGGNAAGTPTLSLCRGAMIRLPFLGSVRNPQLRVEPALSGQPA